MAGLRAAADHTSDQLGTVDTILSAHAVKFLHALHQHFAPRRKKLLAERRLRQERFDRGDFPEFLASGGSALDAEWTIAPIPEELARRKVIVTGAARREALSQALAWGASAFVADFDDCSSPLWTQCLEAQANLRDANGRIPVRGTNQARSQAQSAIVFLRPRSWLHEEKHFSVDGAPISASLFDFGLYFAHNAAALLARGSAPYFSLPKLEDVLEARLWQEIFAFAEEHLGIPHGSIRAVVPIETLSAVFAMEEILFELRDYAFALGCSPSNYLAGYIQALRAHRDYLLPECNDLSMEQPFLHAYRELLLHTCHKRGARAIGACDPQLPVYNDSRRNRQWAKTTARMNALNESEMGFDATSVGDPELLSAVEAALAEKIPGRRPIQSPAQSPIHSPTQSPVQSPTQSGKDRQSQGDRRCYISSSDLICRARGQITAAALKENVEAALGHLEVWLSGQAAERRGNMATAELCRAQLWQWIRHSARLAAGEKVDRSLVECLIRDFSAAAACRLGDAEFAASQYPAAGEILLDGCKGDLEFPLSIRAYSRLA